MFVLYGKPNCPGCVAAKSLLINKDVEYKYIDVSVDAEALTFLKNTGEKALPVIYKDIARLGGLKELKEALS